MDIEEDKKYRTIEGNYSTLNKLIVEMDNREAKDKRKQEEREKQILEDAIPIPYFWEN